MNAAAAARRLTSPDTHGRRCGLEGKEEHTLISLLPQEELGWSDERRHARKTAHLARYPWTPLRAGDGSPRRIPWTPPPPSIIISISSPRPQSKVLSRTRNPHAVCSEDMVYIDSSWRGKHEMPVGMDKRNGSDYFCHGSLTWHLVYS
jgi:hypothetical protein